MKKIKLADSAASKARKNRATDTIRQLGYDRDYRVADFGSVDYKALLRVYGDLYPLAHDLDGQEQGILGSAGLLCEEAFRLVSIAIFDFLKLPVSMLDYANDSRELNDEGTNARQVLSRMCSEVAMVRFQVPSPVDYLVDHNGGRFIWLLDEISRKLHGADRELESLHQQLDALRKRAS